MSDLEREKANAAAAAVREVSDGMLVGLGTGSTAAYAVKELGRRVSEGLKVSAVATSTATQQLAESVGISVVHFGAIASVDLTIDGADEIGPNLQLIKGGGGALLREKIVATASTRAIVIVDSSKPVDRLGRFRLPVEVLPYAATFVERRLRELGAPVAQRLTPNGPFRTDQDAFIYDVSFGAIHDPFAIATALEAIPGVLEHGLFLTEFDTALIGRDDEVEIIHRKSVETSCV
jgi:ribose 5-phosphate isomerase A